MSEPLIRPGPWILGLRVVLAAFFVFMAARNLSGDEGMAQDFARWGYPDWFRVATAWLQIAGGVALLVPFAVLPGALLLTCVLLGAVATHVRYDPPASVLSPAVFLVLISCVLIAYRPGVLRVGG